MLKTIPLAFGLILTFILIFSATNLTIKATTLSYPCLLLCLTSQGIIFCYGVMYGYLCIGLIAFLVLLGILYTMFIKQIYIKETQIIKELKEKDIIA